MVAFPKLSEIYVKSEKIDKMHISENQGSNLAPSPEEKVWLHIQKNILFKIGRGKK